jgi:hypothetical protein
VGISRLLVSPNLRTMLQAQVLPFTPQLGHHSMWLRGERVLLVSWYYRMAFLTAAETWASIQRGKVRVKAILAGCLQSTPALPQECCCLSATQYPSLLLMTVVSRSVSQLAPGFCTPETQWPQESHLNMGTSGYCSLKHEISTHPLPTQGLGTLYVGKV